MAEQSARKHEEIPHHMQFFKWAQMNKLSPEAIGIINSYCHVPNKEVRHFFEKLMEYYNKQMLYEKKYYEEKERRRREEEKKRRDREHYEEKKRRYYEDKKRRERTAAGPSHTSAYIDRETAPRSVDDIRKEAHMASSSSPSTSSPRVSTPSYQIEEIRKHANIAYSSPRVYTPAYQPDDDDIQFICEQPSQYIRERTDMVVKKEVEEAGPSRQDNVAPIADHPESPPYRSPAHTSTLPTKHDQPVVPITKSAPAAALAASAGSTSNSNQRPTTSSTKPSAPQSRPVLKKPVGAPQSHKHVNAERHIPRREDVPQPQIEPLTLALPSVSVHAASTATTSIVDPRSRPAPSVSITPAAKPLSTAAPAAAAAPARKPSTSMFLPSSIKEEPSDPVATTPAVAPVPPVAQHSRSSLLPTRHIKTERLSALDEWASVEEVVGSPRSITAATISQPPPPSTTPTVSPNDMQPIKNLRIKQEPIDATETTPPVHDPALVQILSSYLVKLNQQVNRLNAIKGKARSKKLQSAIFNSEVEELADPGVTFKMAYFKKLTDYVSAIVVKMSNELKHLNVPPASSLEASLQSVKDDVDKILRRAERAVQAHEGAGPSNQTSSISKRKNSDENEGKMKKKRDDVSSFRSPDSTTH